jgi:hypothetical protein
LVSSLISDNLADGISTSGTVTVRTSTISGNYYGLDTSGTVTIDSSTISGHQGYGIRADGPLSIINSTVSGNDILGFNPAASILASDLNISFSTITDNVGGVSATGNVVVSSSILAGNHGAHPDLLLASRGSDCCELTVTNSLIGNGVESWGDVEFPMRESPVGFSDPNGNLIGGPINGAIAPRLGPLRDNGGPTLTHALLADSPAINMGDPAAIVGATDIPRFDQRGEPYARVMEGRIDMGALESRPVGDSNGDGVFDSADLVLVFQAGKYEDASDDNATFDEGDWNGDGDFDTSDLVFAFQVGNYLSAATPLAAVVDQLFSNDRDEHFGTRAG